MPQLRLTTAHTHAGVIYPPGHVLDVDAPTARWLTQNGIAKPADAEVHLASERSTSRRSIPSLPPSPPFPSPSSSSSSITPKE